MQDESQDESKVQRETIGFIARPHRNYMVVGDVAQAIYGFRGSDPSGMMNFETEWPGAKTISMERNYRCGLAIAEAANGSLRAMKEGTHLGMQIKAERAALGAIETAQHEDMDVEAESVVRRIRELNADGLRWRDMVVLVRTNAQTRALEEAAISERIPYQIVGGISFYERREVKDLLAYLRIAAGTGTFDDVRRCINAPFRFLGKAFVDRIGDAAGVDSRSKRGSREDRRDGGSLDWTGVVRSVIDGAGLQDRQRTSAREWCALVDEMSARVSAGRDRASASLRQGQTADEMLAPYPAPEMGTAADEEMNPSTPERILEDILQATDYVRFLTRDEGSESPENNRVSNVRELVRASRRFGTVDALLTYIEETVEAARRAKAGDEEGVDRVTMMSIHRCVHPSTLVETDQGLIEIGKIADAGTIGTADGPHDFRNRVDFAERKLLRIKTTRGYEIAVTDDHGMMVWNGTEYARVDAGSLKIGDTLRLKIGAAVEPTVQEAALPGWPLGVDLRAERYRIPQRVTADVAEFLGLMVADGTVYDAGFRLKKRHEDVRDRFAELARKLFGCEPHITGVEPDFIAEVNSTFLSQWLCSIDGLRPCDKRVPEQVLRSSTLIQAAFLRGLFEDGTVNLDSDGQPDHVSWSTAYPRMAEIVQTMLLRIGIVSSRFEVLGNWRVAVYESDLPVFRDRVGFVSSMKNERIRVIKPLKRSNAVVPVDVAWVREHAPTEPFWHRVNAIQRGHVSRLVATSWKLDAQLAFHHDRIVSIESEMGPAVCVEVPAHGRFLQNGFDGCNSKGLEYRAVFVVGVNQGILPHGRCEDPNEERRLFYVAVTRAKDFLSLTCVRHAALGARTRELVPSQFLAEAGLSVVEVAPPAQADLSTRVDVGAELGMATDAGGGK